MRISRVTFGCRGVLTFDRMEESRLHDWESERYYIGCRMPQRYRLLHPNCFTDYINSINLDQHLKRLQCKESANCKNIYPRPRKRMLLKIDLKRRVR